MQEIHNAEPTEHEDLKEIPPWQKYALTIPEASIYFHIGINKLHKLINENKNARFLLWVGCRALIKRNEFEKFLDTQNAI